MRNFGQPSRFEWWAVFSFAIIHKKGCVMTKKAAFHNDEVVLDIHDRPKLGSWLGLSVQHLFSMFHGIGANPGGIKSRYCAV